MNEVPTPFSSLIETANILPYAFYVVALCYVVFSVILYYHWQTYSTNVRMNFLTYVSYFAISVPLLLILAGAAVL